VRPPGAPCGQDEARLKKLQALLNDAASMGMDLGDDDDDSLDSYSEDSDTDDSDSEDSDDASDPTDADYVLAPSDEAGPNTSPHFSAQLKHF